MKRTILFFAIIAVASSALQAQKPVKEKDLKGVWQLVIDIDKEEVREDIEDEDNVFASVLAKGITNMVFDLIDEIDIRFEFLPDNRLRIEANVFGASEVEYAEWHINSDGELIIDDTDNFRVSNDEGDNVWLKEGEHLVAFERKGYGKHKNKEVYLKRVD